MWGQTKAIYIYRYHICLCYKSSPVLLPLSTKPIVSSDVLVTKSSLTPLAVKVLSIIPLEMQESLVPFEGNIFLRQIPIIVINFLKEKPSQVPYLKNPTQPHISILQRNGPSTRVAMHITFSDATWRIIPFSKWLIALVNKSPNWGYSPSKWPFHGLKIEVILTTYKSWDDVPKYHCFRYKAHGLCGLSSGLLTFPQPTWSIYFYHQCLYFSGAMTNTTKTYCSWKKSQTTTWDV